MVYDFCTTYSHMKIKKTDKILKLTILQIINNYCMYLFVFWSDSLLIVLYFFFSTDRIWRESITIKK